MCRGAITACAACSGWESTPRFTERRPKQFPMNELRPTLRLPPRSAPATPRRRVFSKNVGGVKLPTGKTVGDLMGRFRPLTPEVVRRRLRAIVPRPLGDLTEKRRRAVKATMAAQVHARLHDSLTAQVATASKASLDDPRHLTLDDLKRTLDLVEIDLGKAVPIEFDEIVTELRRCNKEQRTLEMTDWASSRALAVKYLLANRHSLPADHRARLTEQENLIWAQRERKLQWRVLDSVATGDFHTAAHIDAMRSKVPGPAAPVRRKR
ncbi:Uncharacterized protein PBTT_01826 [Plasmodiophora brassicae]